MFASWAGPGYDVGAALGSSAGGSLWHGIEVATGTAVVLRRLPAGTDAAAARRSAILLRTLPTAYLLQVRAVLEVAGGVVVVTELHAGSMTRLLDIRGRLDPAEVATVAVGLLQALGALHRRALVHGGITLGRLLLSRRGVPLLATSLAAGLPPGATRAVGGDAGPQAAPDDVAAAARLCRQLLTGHHDAGADRDSRFRLDVGRGAAPDGPETQRGGGALAELFDGVLAARPSRRPAAAELEVLVRAIQEPARIRLGRAADQDLVAELTAAPAVEPVIEVRAGRNAGRNGHRGHLRPRPLTALAALALLAGGLGWLSDRIGAGDPAAASAPLLSGPARSPAVVPGAGTWLPRVLGAARGTPRAVTGPASEPATLAGAPPELSMTTQAGPRVEPAGWRQCVADLEAARDQALARADPALLPLADVPGTALADADRGVIESLRRGGRSARGLRHGVRSVVVVGAHGQLELLVVVDELAAYDIVDRAGRRLEHRPARGAQAFDVTLLRTGRGYRLLRVTPR